MGGGEAVWAVGPAVSLSAAPAEWWQRLAVAWRAWAGRHERLVRRLRVARAVWLWGSLAWLLVLLVVRPEVRESLRVFVAVYWLLLVWFFLARTRTVSWRAVAGMFAVGVVWAGVVGLALRGLAQQVGAHHFGSVTVPGQVRGLGPMVAIAGVGEESAKLVPLVVVAVVAAVRVRRFAVTDWLLLGFASCLGFQAFEELARRVTAHVTRPGLLDLLLGDPGDRGPATGYPQYGLGPWGGWSTGGAWGAVRGAPGYVRLQG